MAGLNYSHGHPVGNNQIPQYECPPLASTVAIYGKDNATASSVITLTADTTAVEVAALGGNAVIRWVKVGDGTTAATSVIGGGASANFDYAIPTGTVRRFVVPIEVQTNVEGYSSAVGANIANGLYRRLAFKSTGTSSVYVTEYGF